jgi:hypothetical protein
MGYAAGAPGDKVEFEPAQVNGQYTIMKIERRRNDPSGSACTADTARASRPVCV